MSQNKRLKRVLIMAGGTGGHVFPGLSVAEYLRKHQVEIQWLGTANGLEAKLVPQACIPIHQIKISGVRGKSLTSILSAPVKITASIFSAYQLIRKFQPDVVIGMGGFVSGPGGIAAWLARKPLIIHEQNAIAGMTNKILARFAKKILEAFPGAFGNQQNVMTVGNPVRTSIEMLPPPQVRDAARPLHLLIIGGSLGALALNELVPKAISLLPGAMRPIIRHQAGHKNVQQAQKIYQSLGVEAEIFPFIDDMNNAYAWADVVLCRSGALTVSELCVAGRGAIFVPYPYAVDDHQTVNASFMVNHQAAICLPQKHLTPESLAEVLRQFAEGPQKSFSMAQAAYALRKPNVAQTIYTICQEICP